MKDAFGVDGRELVSKWTEVKDKGGKTVMSGGYYGDYTIPKGSKVTYTQKRKKLLGLIPRKPVQRTKVYDKDTTAPVLRYRTTTGQDKWVLPSDMPREGFSPSKVKVQTQGPNYAKFKAQGVAKGFLGIGDDKRVRSAKIKQEASRANTDLAAAATAAGVSPFATREYNRRIQPRASWLPVVPEPRGSMPGLRRLAPLKAAQGVSSAFGPKAAAVAKHPATLAGASLLVGVPLTVHNYREHQKDERRVKRLEVRYPKRKKAKK